MAAIGMAIIYAYTIPAATFQRAADLLRAEALSPGPDGSRLLYDPSFLSERQRCLAA
jgi:hypothetical protein